MSEPEPRLVLPHRLTAGLGAADRLLRRRLPWLIVLAVLQLPGAWLVLRASGHGRANIDIVHQARQARGEIPFDDWHPPVMSALWKVIVDVTGSLTPLFLLQVGVYFLCGWLISVLLLEQTGRRGWSLLGAAFPLLPHTVSQVGMLWKDTQMACALLAGTLLLLRVDPRRPRTLLWLIPSLLLVVYATAVRKNAVFAVLPLLILVGWQLAVLWCARSVEARSPVRVPAWRLLAGTAVAGAVVLGGVQAVTTGVDRAHDVRPTGQLSQIMLDDVIFSVPPAEIAASDAPEELRSHLLRAQEECRAGDEIWDAYWNCYGRGATGEPFSPIAHQEALRALWLDTVPTHPVRYLSYRAAAYADYLSSSRLEYWKVDWNGDGATVGLGGGDRHLDRVLEDYVIGIGVETLPWLFRPWLWLALGTALLLAAPRLPQARGAVAVLSGSGVLYILGYFAIIPADHFRYTWWPALAITLAVLVALAARRAPQLTP